jgi:hypothetical protein
MPGTRPGMTSYETTAVSRDYTTSRNISASRSGMSSMTS